MEKVLVVDRESMEKMLPESRFITENIPKVVRFILESHMFVDRELAEYNPTLKQIIPYVVIKKDGRFFVMTRLKKQTESRLHGKMSLGAGGHINTEDMLPGKDIIQSGLFRELEEEMGIDKVVSLTPVGIINTNTGGISDYHMALVYVLEASGNVAVRETEKMMGQWASAAEVNSKYEYFEDWSQVVIDHLANIEQKAL